MRSKEYKRRWRNLVLDPTYQLVFTMVLVGTCAMFMAGLGWVVLRQVDVTTETAKANISGEPTLDPVLAQQAIDKLEARQRLLTRLLFGTGIVLCLGLFFYGIKMTHHVAGPLHKVSLYCDKVTGGKFDKIYNLRKGDQLQSFYEHFKQAYETLKAKEQRDVACLVEVLKAAAADGAGNKSPEVARRLAELREILMAKEVGLG